MGRFSIRTKITAWFSAALILIVAMTYFVVLAVSDQVIQKTIRDNLIETIENNVDEVEFFPNIDGIDLVEDVDHFIRYKNGYLEIDDDYLDEVNQIYTSLYMSDGAMLYGENPIAEETADLKFLDSQIQRISAGGSDYYVFDCKLTANGVDGLWLRGVVSELQGDVQMASISHTSLIVLPTLMLITIIGGYLIAGRILRPIRRISDSALAINQGHDLKRRIEVGKGKDELQQLANNFNGMIERLDNAFQSERQFTSDASHELRTPIAVILAQCELTLEQDCTVEEYKESLTVVERQGRKMSKMINEMLDFARLELKADQYEMVEMDLTELVESVCEDMALIRENNISLETAVEQEVYYTGNRGLLTRLLSNLITNAYRYGKENGHILVSLSRQNGSIYLAVKDDGVGIKKEEQDRIFDRFYQADNSRTGAGTGLGLAMVKEIARFHNGTITVESEPDKGSIFTLKLEEK